MSPPDLDFPRVQDWRARNPQQWWAFNQLSTRDPLRDRVLAAILAAREQDEALEDLVSFGEALEGWIRSQRVGCSQAPPLVGQRRSFEVRIVRLKRRLEGPPCFRVDFATMHGWSGFFDTRQPSVVERVSNNQRRREPRALTVVGEVTRHHHEFLLELDRVALV